MAGLDNQIWAMNAHDTIRRKLENLETEHRDLDDVITRIAVGPAYDQLQVQRLKKRRLTIRRSRVLPLSEASGLITDSD